MEFVLIPAGEFIIGCSSGDRDCENSEKPQHKVKITKPFYMGKYEVTQEQWEVAMWNRPSHFNHCGDGCPVEKVSWEDVQEFIGKLHSLVWEWVNDWYDENYYSRKIPDRERISLSVIDPKGPETGSCRVLREGYWGSSAQNIRVSGRNFSNPGRRYISVGFRLVFLPEN